MPIYLFIPKLDIVSVPSSLLTELRSDAVALPARRSLGEAWECSEPIKAKNVSNGQGVKL